MCLSIITKEHIISCQSISKKKNNPKISLILSSSIMKCYFYFFYNKICHNPNIFELISYQNVSYTCTLYLLQNQEHIYCLFMTINLQFSTRRALLAPILFLPIAFILLDEPWYPALLPFLSFLCLSATSSSSVSRVFSKCLKRIISAF